MGLRMWCVLSFYQNAVCNDLVWISWMFCLENHCGVKVIDGGLDRIGRMILLVGIMSGNAENKLATNVSPTGIS